MEQKINTDAMPLCSVCETSYLYLDTPGNWYCRSSRCINAKPKEKLRNFNGVISTALPRLELIPKSTLESLAKRMELGIERKGDGAWNALTQHNSESLSNSDFVTERLSHCIHHCYDAIRKIVNNKIHEEEEEDDAGAILFAGSVLAEYKRLYALKSK